MSIATRVQSTADGLDVLHVVLARPEQRNAVNAEMVDALHAAVDRVVAEDAVRALVLESADPAIFCAGADIRVGEEERRYVSDRLYGLYERLVRLPVPVLAAVSGAAVGGGAQLVLSSDITLGGPGARIRFVGAGHGLAIGTWGLASLVGRGRALDLSLSMRWVEHDEAVAMGLLTRSAPDPEAAAAELAAELAGYDATAVARVKRLVNEPDLVERLRAERAANAGWSGAVEARRKSPTGAHRHTDNADVQPPGAEPVDPDPDAAAPVADATTAEHRYATEAQESLERSLEVLWSVEGSDDGQPDESRP